MAKVLLNLLLATASYAVSSWYLAACSSCTDKRPIDIGDGGDSDIFDDAGPDAGVDAGEVDGGTFVPPGPFALQWVVCLDDLAYAYQDYGNGVAVLSDGRIATAGQVNYPTISSFLTVFEEDGTVAWLASYMPTGSADSSQIIGMNVAEMGDGDVVTTGRMLGTVLLSGIGSPIELESVEDWSYFLARYTSGGTVRWALATGSAGTSASVGWDVVAAPDDTTIVTGSISGAATFGAGEPNETTLSSAGAFIAKYDADGALLWAKGTTGRKAIGRGLIVLEDAGEVAQVGDISATGPDEAVTFGPGEANEKTIVPQGSGDVFVARYAIEDGALKWVVRAGSADPGGEEQGHDAVGHGSDVVLVGGCGGDAEFGDLTLAGEMTNGFIASSSPDGGFPWIKGIGWNSLADARGIAADTEGLYVVGHVGGGTAIFGYGEVEETSFSLPMTSDYYGFLARYGFDGVLEWAGIIPSADLSCEIHPWGVAVASEDEFVVSGEYWNDEASDVATFGWDEDGNPVTCDGDQDHPFVAKYRVQ